jgi:hypothetical protein
MIFKEMTNCHHMTAANACATRLEELDTRIDQLVKFRRLLSQQPNAEWGTFASLTFVNEKIEEALAHWNIEPQR